MRAMPLLLFFLALPAFGQSALPPCDTSLAVSAWTNCQGTATWTKSNNKYVGEFRSGKPHGQGAATWANGNTYFGEWSDGKANGQGTYTFANGNIYIGEWGDDKPNGQGSYTFANGTKYVGEFRDNKYQGQGMFTFTDGRPPLEGVWEDNKFVRAQRIPDHIAGRSPTPIGEPNITPDKASSSDVGQTAPRVLIPGLDAIKAKCAELGFKSGTEKFGDCVLKLSK